MCDLCLTTYIGYRPLPRLRLCARIGGPLDLASSSSQFVVSSMSYRLVLGDFFQSRTLLLSLSELSGPGLESGVFVTADSPGLLVLFWDLHLPKSLCFTGGAILVTSTSANSDGRLLLFCCYFDLAPRARSSRHLLVKTSLRTQG